MEFNEKLQQLRKHEGITQEELAEAIFVSRTAVSKWESGRGYPGIESLKALAKYFDVTVDALLSCDEILTIAEDDTKQKAHNLMDLIFGLIDCSAATLLFLPLFGQKVGDAVQEFSLFALTTVSSWLKAVYAVLIIALMLTGVFTLALQNYKNRFWCSAKRPLSLVINAVAAIAFIASKQPYAAALLFVFFAIKAFISAKTK